MKRGTLQLPAVRLAYVDFGGDGPGLLLLHGLMGRATTWAATAEWLAPHYHVVALDQRGHGWSDKPADAYSREAYVDDAAAAIQTLGLGPAVVIGHSMGALNAWGLAARHPELVRGLVLEDMAANRFTQAEVQSWRDWFASWPLPFHSLADVRRFYTAEDSPRDGDFFIEVMREDQDGYRPMFAFEHMLQTLEDWTRHDYAPELERVQCPALVVKGGLSSRKASDLQAMARRLPKGRYAQVQGAGHVIHFDQPEGWRAAVEPFLLELRDLA